MPQIMAAREKLRGFEERIFDIICKSCTAEQVSTDVFGRRGTRGCSS